MAEASIDRLTLDIVVNNENATRRINAVTKAIEKLNTAMGKSGNIDKVLGKINNVSPTSTRGGNTSKGGSTSKKDKNVGIFASLGKWNYAINMTRYYGRQLANIVQLGMDYVETQNLWQVANRNNLEMADEFISKMNKAYGVSEQTLMNYQAIFKNMLSALGGINDEISSKLSMQMTQMAIDFSSLYNVTIPSAMQKFQAILSGQVRPIRSVSGYDITENTIFDLYAGAGGQKTMRQLSQIEKRLLRIVAVFDQMSGTGAVGDMGKTIESASNQARIMSEQFKETLTWSGQLVLMFMESAGVLQKINAFLIMSKEIMRSIAHDLGYEDKNFLDGLVTSSEEATEAVDKIQGKLLSFDRFESLNPSESNILGIDQTVLDLLERINYQTEDFKMQATELADEWLKNLGFIDQNGDGILDITEKARKLLDTVKAVGIALGAVVGIAIIKSIVTFGTSLFTWIISPMGLITLGIMAIAAGAYLIIKNWDAVSSFFSDLWKGIANGFASFINYISNAFIAFVNLCIDSLNILLKPLDVIAGWFGGSIQIPNWDANVNWQPYPAYATGGFPEDGLFFANSGEMVGKFTNGKTAVANNDQIVAGITEGVYGAMMAYNAQTRSSGVSGDVILNGQKVGRIVARGSHKEMVRAGYLK